MPSLYAREGFDASAHQRVPPPREPDLFGQGALPILKERLWPRYHPDALARGPLVQTDLARTLEAVAAGGRDAFYRDDLARRLVTAAARCGQPAGPRGPGRSPVGVDGAAHHLRTPRASPPAFPRPPRASRRSRCSASRARSTSRRLSEADYVHVLVEAAKLAFVDRDRHLTDPGRCAWRPTTLLDADHLARLAGRITLDRALPTEPAPPSGGDTIAHRDGRPRRQRRVADPVALLHVGLGGRGRATPASCCRTAARSSRSTPATSTRSQPGKRTMHTLIPSMYLEGGRPRFVYGTMGGEGPAPDAGRRAHAHAPPRSRPAGRRRGAALALRPHVGGLDASAEPGGALRAGGGSRSGRARSRRDVRPRPGTTCSATRT